MSSVAGKPGHPPPPAEFGRLEDSVRRMLEEFTALRRRAAQAEARVRQLEGTVAQLSGGAFDPEALLGRVHALEAENRQLRARLDTAAAHVRRLLARINFLEEEA
ncbi:MAG TPA: hypothetical protein VFQ38_00355 [Longimicrobiales bacterium]|nr:hypothetical protein [Longimicrobiales bacterium]